MCRRCLRGWSRSQRCVLLLLLLLLLSVLLLLSLPSRACTRCDRRGRAHGARARLLQHAVGLPGGGGEVDGRARAPSTARDLTRRTSVWGLKKQQAV